MGGAALPPRWSRAAAPSARRPSSASASGLRPKHYADVLARARRGELEVDWFEAISENYMVAGGRPPRVLGEVRAHAPLVLHGVSLNLGSTDPLDAAYLRELAALAARFEPAWISDHLCWTGVRGENLHDLLPLPYTRGVACATSPRASRACRTGSGAASPSRTSPRTRPSAPMRCPMEGGGAGYRTGRRQPRWQASAEGCRAARRRRRAGAVGRRWPRSGGRRGGHPPGRS